MLSARLSSKALSFGCAVLVCGCVPVPKTQPQVTEISSQTLGLGAEPAPAVTDTWWEGFHDPQVDRLIGQMLQNNPGLQGVLARIRGAQSELAAAQSQSYPQVSLDGQVQRTLLSGEYVLPAPYGGSWRWVDDIQGKLTWSLDFWGKQAALIDVAQNRVAARSLDSLAARLALAGSFAQAYIGLLLAYQDIDLAGQTMSERQTILDLTQSRVGSGLENDASLEQARALLAAAQADVIAAESDRDLAIHAIAALTGQGAGAYAEITRPTASLETALPLPAALPADLLSRRPDILAARARIASALRGRDAAQADFYPNIDLTAALGFQAVGFTNLFSGNALTMGLGPALHLPVFDAGKLRAQYGIATADVDLAVADYNGAVISAIRQTADALTQIKSLSGRRTRLQDGVDSATRALTLAEERYRLGLSGQIPVLAAENLLQQARRQIAQLNAQLATARVTLLLSAGGGFSPSTSLPAGPPHDE